MSYSTEKVDQLAQLAAELNQETDHLKEVIEGLEKRLSKIKLGVSVWLDDKLEAGSEDEGNVSYRLGFSKVKDKWRIAACRVSRSDDGGEALGEAMALSKAPRIIRVQAIGLFDTLLDALLARTQEFLDTLRRLKPEAETVEATDEPASGEPEEENKALL